MYNRIEVFYAYAREDEAWVQELEKHLSLLQRQGIISTWHPRLIAAGADWQHVTDIHFQKASIILLLISPDFLASDYCYGKEMRRALQREQEKGVCVIPILLRPVDWQHAPFAHLRPLPPDATFLTEWPNLDRAFAEVTTGIRRTIENLSMLVTSLGWTDFPGIWNVPFPRNLFFIGREDLLAQLHTQLESGQTAALSQAISGLGGVGKTQLAVEYAYRHHRDYHAVLWSHAESPETLISSYTEIASFLDLPIKDSQEQTMIIQAVKVWLQNHRDWLLILDNADELNILSAFLPPRLEGHVIITTRAAAPGRFARRLLVETFSEEELRRILTKSSESDDSGSLSTLHVRIANEPFTVRNLSVIFTSLNILYVKCCLIAKRKLDDLIEYTQTHTDRFALEANFVITDITHNSPFHFDISLNPESVAKAMQLAIDAVSLRGLRKKEHELALQAKELEMKLKEHGIQFKEDNDKYLHQMALQESDLESQEKLLEIEKQQLELEKLRFEFHIMRIKCALETAERMVDLLYPGTDEATKGMIVRTLLPDLLQLGNSKGLQLTLPDPQEEPESKDK